MKTSKTQSRTGSMLLNLASRIMLVTVLVVGGLSIQSARAADITYEGDDGTWSTTEAKWTTDGGANYTVWDNDNWWDDIALFSDSFGRVIVDGSINLAGIKVTTASSGSRGGRTVSYLFQGTGSLNFGSQQGVITQESAQSVQIDNNLVGTGGLAINGTSNTDLAPRVLLIGSNVLLSGGITVNNGVLGFNDPAALGNNLITLNTGTLLAPVVYAGTADTRVEGSNSQTVSNAIHLTDDTTNYVNVWGGRALTHSGAITGGGDVEVRDAGTMTLTGDMSAYTGTYYQVGTQTDFSRTSLDENYAYSGDIVIDTGSVRVTADYATGSGKITIGHENTSGADRSLHLVGGVRIANDVDIQYMRSSVGSIRSIGAATSVIEGNVTVLPDIGAVGTYGHLRPDSNSVLRLEGELNVGGGATVIIQQDHTVEYAGGASTNYELRVAGGTARLGADNGMGTGTYLSMASTGTSTFDMNGFDQTLAGIGRHGSSAAIVQNSGTGLSVLTIEPEGHVTYDRGRIVPNAGVNDNIRLVVKGNNTAPTSSTPRFARSLDGGSAYSDYYTGGTEVDGGTFLVGADGLLGAVPATFDADNITLRNHGTLGNHEGNLTLNANRGITLASGGGGLHAGWSRQMQVNGVIAGGVGDNLTIVAGNGPVILAGENTYAGNTVIQSELKLTGAGAIANSGTIQIDAGGTLDVSGTTGTYQIQSGQTVTGIGTISGGLSMLAGSTLSPGNSAGTLTIAGDLTLNGADLAIDIWGVENHDVINFTSGSLSLVNAPTITVDLGGNYFEVGDEFRIITGIAIGNDATWSVGEWGAITVHNPHADWGNKSFEIGEGSVMLTVIPEPNTLGLLMLIGVATVIRRLRMRKG